MVMHPVGPLPASTYWRRRLVLLAVVLVLLVLAAKSCSGGGAGGHPSGATSTPTPTRSASASPAPTRAPVRSASPRPVVTRAAGPTTCTDRVLTLTTAPSPANPTAGSRVSFTVTVKNSGSVPCRRDLGGGALEVVVRSGNDRIWSSDDCSSDHSTSLQTLPAGGSLQTVVTWPGTRSAKGCTGDKAPAKPGTYTATARLGTLTGTLAVFRLS